MNIVILYISDNERILYNPYEEDQGHNIIAYYKSNEQLFSK